MADYMPTIRVLIDGQEFDVVLAQGDYVRAERDGLATDGDMNKVGMSTVIWHALNRLKRKGVITADLPATFDDFLDSMELPPDMEEETDPKGSGPDQATG